MKLIIFPDTLLFETFKFGILQLKNLFFYIFNQTVYQINV